MPTRRPNSPLAMPPGRPARMTCGGLGRRTCTTLVRAQLGVEAPIAMTQSHGSFQ